MTALQIQGLLHEGKAKKVFQTDRPGVVAVQYKDDATAFNAQKKAQLAGKGLLNWEISARLFEALEGQGIASHYLGCLEPGWMVVQANGGSKDKPVGLVYISISGPNNHITNIKKLFNSTRNRAEIQTLSVNVCLNSLRLILLSNSK